MELYGITQNALNQYKRTRGNKNISKLDARKKLTRNIALSYEYNDKKGTTYVYEGNLCISVRGSLIIHVARNQGAEHFYKKVEPKEYERLSKLLGIPRQHRNKFKTKKQMMDDINEADVENAVKMGIIED